MAKYGDSLYPTDCCLICKNEIDLVRHEVFHGPNRQKSKEYGCWVTLCPRCHIDLHDHPAKYRWLQSDTQQLAMDAYGWSEEDFRYVFGKSWI